MVKIIIYYDYIPDYKQEEAEKQAKIKNIELIKIEDNDKINQNRLSNYKYIYKYIAIINEIMEA